MYLFNREIRARTSEFASGVLVRGGIVENWDGWVTKVLFLNRHFCVLTVHKGGMIELGTTQAERFISTIHKYRISRPTPVLLFDSFGLSNTGGVAH